MLICSHCTYANTPGMLFCEDCGRSLENAVIGEGQPTIPTRKMPDDPLDSSARAVWGAARLGKNAAILLHFKDHSDPLTIQSAARVTFGRADNDSPGGPDIDLNPYGAQAKGVSRLHAAIEFSEDTLILLDVGSTNGTYLNGQRLPPNQPRVLRDGDEVRFGKLVSHVYFK
ncbi:MAG: FHA domain-containing protein [Aggregatilineales bacterium]